MCLYLNNVQNVFEQQNSRQQLYSVSQKKSPDPDTAFQSLESSLWDFLKTPSKLMDAF